MDKPSPLAFAGAGLLKQSTQVALKEAAREWEIYGEWASARIEELEGREFMYKELCDE